MSVNFRDTHQRDLRDFLIHTYVYREGICNDMLLLPNPYLTDTYITFET